MNNTAPRPNHEPQPTIRIAPETVPGYRFADHHIQLHTDGRINRTAFAILRTVQEITNLGRPCWATDDYFARTAGCAVKTVKNTVYALIAAGHLTRRWRDGRRWLSLPAEPSTRGIGEKRRGTPRNLLPAPRAPDTPTFCPPRGQHNKTETSQEEEGNPERGNPRSGAPTEPRSRPARSTSRHTKPAPSRSCDPPPASRDRDNKPASVDGKPAHPRPEGPRVFDMDLPATPRDKPAKLRPTPADRERADRLRRYAASRSWFVSKSPRKWADAFGRLRRQLKDREPEIDRALDFLIETRTDRPKIRNGQELIDRWEWVEDAMARHAKTDVAVNISTEARKIADRLDRHDWPKGSDAHVPAVVQRSLDAVRAFHKRLETAADDHPDPAARRLASKLLTADDLSDPLYAVESWMESVHDRIRDWADWRGALTDYVWRPDHRMVTDIGRAAADRYCDDPGVWDELVGWCS